MIPVQNVKYVVPLYPTSATNGQAITSNIVDLIGYDYASLALSGSTSNNATNSPSAVGLTFSDSTSGPFVADASLTGGLSAGNFAIPNSPTATSNQPYIVFNFDTRSRPRYCKLGVTPVTTQTYFAQAVLSRAAVVPISAADMNVSGAVVNA